MPRARKTPYHTLAGLLSLRWLRRERVRDNPRKRLCAMAGHGGGAEAGAVCQAAGSRPSDAGGAQALGADAGALIEQERYDLFEDVIVKIRFERLTRKEQHDQLRRVADWARVRA